MPIYEYECKENGGHKFEKLVPMSDSDKPQECPEHHKESVRIDFSNTNWNWGMEDIHWAAGTSHRKIM